MDKQTENRLQQILELQKENPNIDVASLMKAELESSTEKSSNVPQKSITRAYFVSVFFPPFGLIYALKFYLSGEESAKKAALVCVILTVVSILGLVLVNYIMLSPLLEQAGTNQVNIEETLELLR